MSKVYEVLEGYRFRKVELSLRKSALRADEHWRYETYYSVSVFRRGQEWFIEAGINPSFVRSTSERFQGWLCEELKQAMGASYCEALPKPDYGCREAIDVLMAAWVDDD